MINETDVSLAKASNAILVAFNVKPSKEAKKAAEREKIDINSKQIVETYEVGNGPQQMLIDGDLLWISRTYYSSDWTEIYYGTSQIDLLTGNIQISFTFACYYSCFFCFCCNYKSISRYILLSCFYRNKKFR